MRMIALGNQPTIKNLTDSLTGWDVDLWSPAEVSEITAPIREQNYDLVLVDILAEKAEAACHHINHSCDIPLVLIVRDNETNWKRLELLHADGYLAERVRGAELRARLRALVRRNSCAGHVNKSAGHYERKKENRIEPKQVIRQ
ncbi:hypothetical protein ACFLT8_07485 [Chloroflexota bacterium]